MNLYPKRSEKEPPIACNEWGWEYHHIGMPTSTQMPDEIYLEKFKVFVSGFDSSPYGIEWMRFQEGSPVHEIIQKLPHVAFVVNDLSEAIMGKEVIVEPNQPSEGISVAMILHNGAPIELIEFL
jgi:hypothetical protein